MPKTLNGVQMTEDHDAKMSHRYHGRPEQTRSPKERHMPIRIICDHLNDLKCPNCGGQLLPSTSIGNRMRGNSQSDVVVRSNRSWLELLTNIVGRFRVIERLTKSANSLAHSPVAISLTAVMILFAPIMAFVRFVGRAPSTLEAIIYLSSGFVGACMFLLIVYLRERPLIH